MKGEQLKQLLCQEAELLEKMSELVGKMYKICEEAKSCVQGPMV